MPNVQFTISPAPGITNDLIAVIYNTLAPAAEVDRLLKAPPHAAPYNFNFTNLPVGTYIVKIHESPDGVALGTLRHDFWVNAAINSVTAYTPKTFQVGLGRPAPYYDPAPGDTTYNNPDLDGLDYLVSKPGYSFLDWDADITKVPGGGFTFTNGQDFFNGEIYTILVNNLIQTTSGGTPTASFPVGVETIPGTILFGPTYYKKIIEVSSVTNCDVSIANLDTIPDGTVFSIDTNALLSDDFDAPFRFVRLTVNTGRYIRLNGKDRGYIHIGRGESIQLVKFGNYLRVVGDYEPYRSLGQIVYTTGNPPLNSIRLTGVWLPIIFFQRLYDEVVSQLAEAIISATEDFPPPLSDSGKWIIGPTKIWFPDYGGMFLRITDPDGNIDSVRIAGSFQDDSVGNGNVRTTAFTGATVGHNFLANDGVGFAATHGDGGVVTVDESTGTNRSSARTSTWPIISTTGQTRPKNTAINAYVLI